MPEEKKSTYRGYTSAQKEATKKYMKEHLEEFKVRIPKGRKAYYKEQAEAFGMSLNAFCLYAMDKLIKEKTDSSN